MDRRTDDLVPRSSQSPLGCIDDAMRFECSYECVRVHRQDTPTVCLIVKNLIASMADNPIAYISFAAV